MTISDQTHLFELEKETHIHCCTGLSRFILDHSLSHKRSSLLLLLLLLIILVITIIIASWNITFTSCCHFASCLLQKLDVNSSWNGNGLSMNLVKHVQSGGVNFVWVTQSGVGTTYAQVSSPKLVRAAA